MCCWQLEKQEWGAERKGFRPMEQRQQASQGSQQGDWRKQTQDHILLEHKWKYTSCSRYFLISSLNQTYFSELSCG